MNARTFITNTLATVAITLLIGTALSTAHLLDEHDGQAEMAQARAMEQQQREDARALRRDMAAAAMCREQHGEAGYTFTEAGQLVCIPRRGRKVAM